MESRRISSPRALAIAIALAAAVFAGCGSTEADLANGKAKFAACGGCHTLADAGTRSTTGPNLDDAFRGARQHDFEQSTFEGVVRKWIEQPEQVSEPVMPANIVTGDDARDVAAYVASVAGKTPESPARPAEEIE